MPEKKTTKKRSTAKKKSIGKKDTLRKKSTAKRGSKKITLLSGGNPQIAKADGEAPVQAYIAAMPGWKRDVGRMIDDLVSKTVPGVRKAVRWNTPFYGIEGKGWFLSFHCFTKYIKLTWHNGASLNPVPPFESKYPAIRYSHIFEDKELDQKQLAKWIRQASKEDGETLF